MEKQSQIKRTLAQPSAIEAIRGLLDSGAHKTRSSVAEAVCRHFDFVDARERTQTAGCVKALRELERAGHFALPAVHNRGGIGKSARRLDEPVAMALDVPAQAGDVRGLSLIKVVDLDQMRLWNEMMLCEHPQGAGPLVGAQMRYLIGSEHGWLGGFGFGAAALQLADRDLWIGWDAHTRREHLHRVVGMSRFLIRQSVRCQNLASRVQAMALRRIGADYEAQYGYRPWLVESFVDTAHFIGTSYRAANWLAIGQTRGRGRQDREHDHAKSIKTIYVYALEADLRARMGVAEPSGWVLPRIVDPSKIGESLEVGAGLDGAEWATNEFGGTELGDQRLNERLVDIARAQGSMPGRAFCGVVKGDAAAVKGYYRLIDKPDDSQVTMAAILAPHRRRTEQRMKAQSTVLCIQDGTDLNYSGLVQCDGLGVIGSNQTGAQSGGLHLHSTLVVSTEGLPLGVLDAQCTAPIPKPKDDHRATTAIPIEEKKTFSWIKAMRDCSELAKQLPDTRQVCVMDREGDVFEVFDEQRQTGRIDLLVRAKHDRGTNDDSGLGLFESVRQSPAQGAMRINVQRQSARAKKSKQKARAGRKQRMAEVDLRFRQIELRPPSYHKEKEPIAVSVVQETSPPADAEPIESQE